MTMTTPSDVVEIAALVSDRICTSFHSHVRVSRVHDDESTIEIENCGHPCDVEQFWPPGCPLSNERKESLFWQYHRARGCNLYAATLAKILKELSDCGVKLTHNGYSVVDILVLNCTEFDVSDILSVTGKNAVLKVHDPVSNTTVPCIASYETIDRWRGFGEGVCFRLGMKSSPPDDDDARKVTLTLKKHRPESYTGAVPHWWVAVVVEGAVSALFNGSREYYMVHLDVCGAAYDPKALVKAPESDALVSLQTFKTPEYEMIPNCDGVLAHKLQMKATTSERDPNPLLPGAPGRVALQPKSIRHFRCYHKNDTSSIEVTPVATYLDRSENAFDDDYQDTISDTIACIKQNVILHLPIGSKVTVCNIQSKPELNGRFAVVCKSKEKDKIASDRVPLQIQGQKTPLSLKASCIQLPAPTIKQYQTLEEKKKQYNKSLEESDEYQEAKKDTFTVKQKSQINKGLQDPDVVKVLSIMQTGQLVFSCYADPELKRGIGKLLKPPLDAMLPKSMTKNIIAGYELSNHPKANEAIKLINLMKGAKQRVIAQGGDSSYEQLFRVQSSAAQRIRADEGLTFVFNRLQELGMYTNPANLDLDMLHGYAR